MAKNIEHFIIASLLSFIFFSNKRVLWELLHPKEDEAINIIENKIGSSVAYFSKVGVGVNANIDLIVSALQVFSNLQLESHFVSKDHAVISTLEELEECFNFYFKKCAAAERVVTSKSLFYQIIEAAKNTQNAQYDVGGNAALMALKLVTIGNNTQVLLGGPIGPKLESLLDNRIVIPSSMKQDQDEYHLILEYKKGDTWGGHKSLCANRFIITHDKANSEMQAMDNFFESLISFKPDLIIVSGLHLLESQPPNVIEKKLSVFRAHLQQIPSTTPIHLELASMTSVQLTKDIANQIFPVVDSIGLNEQELAFLSTSLNGPGSPNELAQWPPEIGLMADIIDWLLQFYGRNARYGSDSSRLTRIHFHCLTYHLMAVFPEYWNNSLLATVAGSHTASTQACDKEKLTSLDVELRIPKVFARSVHFWELRRYLVKQEGGNPLTSWSHNGLDYNFCAVLVCKEAKKTVGLGDSISAVGLQYSDFIYM